MAKPRSTKKSGCGCGCKSKVPPSFKAYQFKKPGRKSKFLGKRR